MALKANLKEAVDSLYTAKQRSLLALIGIVIGIGSVIAMVSVGVIAKQQAIEQFKELGTEYLTVKARGSRGTGAGISLDAALGLAEQTSSIAAAAPWSQMP